DLPPSYLGQSTALGLQGVVTEEGGEYSHAAIIARAKGIPYLTQIRGLLQEVQQGDVLIIDGFSGELWINPEQDVLLHYEEKINSWTEEKKKREAQATLPCLTIDGYQIQMMANIGDSAEVEAALAAGAEGIGLFRTEFLFLDKHQAPTEEEQYTQYK
uniref:putative PEP-binding protein n=1 Tax=Proteus mirabilis TaxID=584 RepID=UPI000F0E159F